MGISVALAPALGVRWDLSMRATLAILGVMLVAGCGPEVEEIPCPPSDGVTTAGEDPPDLALTLQIAGEWCGRPFVGRIQWTDESVDGTWGIADYRRENEGCGVFLRVIRERYEDGSLQPAYNTIINHELGHWCTHTHNEDEANAFALSLNAEALHRVALRDGAVPEH